MTDGELNAIAQEMRACLAPTNVVIIGQTMAVALSGWAERLDALARTNGAANVKSIALRTAVNTFLNAPGDPSRDDFEGVLMTAGFVIMKNTTGLAR